MSSFEQVVYILLKNILVDILEGCVLVVSRLPRLTLPQT